MTVTYSESMLLPSSLLLSDCSDLHCVNVSWFNFILFWYSGRLCFGKSPHYSLCFRNLIIADSTRLLQRFQAHDGILGWRVSWRGFTQYVLALNFAPLVFWWNHSNLQVLDTENRRMGFVYPYYHKASIMTIVWAGKFIRWAQGTDGIAYRWWVSHYHGQDHELNDDSSTNTFTITLDNQLIPPRQ